MINLKYHENKKNNNYYSVVQMLIDHNYCDLMKDVDVDGNTPLHLACMHGYEEVALYLMKNHADIGARYDTGINKTQIGHTW